LARRLEYGSVVVLPRRGYWWAGGALIAVATVAGCFLSLREGTRIKTGRNVPPSAVPFRGLPRGASNVSYSVGGMRPVTAYEFDIGEEAFLKWAADRGWEVSKTSDATIYRFDNTRATIQNGYAYDWDHEDSGVNVAYDIDKGRAYYLFDSR
jgi:hypothetical protein